MKRSKHNLSHYHLMTAKFGLLYPVGCVEVLPGDTFRHRTSFLLRVAPMLAPVMHPVHVRLHHFFVPYRLVWDQWEDFITGGVDNDGSITPPTIVQGPLNGDLLDYLGVPPTQDQGSATILSLNLRAYNLVYNEYYRDQDLVPERAEEDRSIPRVAWGRDYLTSSRPFTQRGPAVSVPIGGTAPVTGDVDPVQFTGSGNVTPALFVNRTDAGTANPYNDLRSNVSPGPNEDDQDPLGWALTNASADLSQATSVDINDFRKAFALQRYAEARARYGSRYTEYLAYLGVRAQDARLQRPEYLGGGKQTISFSEVLQTAQDQTTPVGTLRGHGIAAMRSNRYRKFFAEHGVVLTLLSIRPRSIYTTACHRKWFRFTKEDFFQRELAHIGQQPIYNNEVWMQDDNTGLNTFGYADRYEDYKHEPSRVSGEFRSLLDYWHLSRTFAQAPVLNQSFIECNPSNRIFAEQTQDNFWLMINHSLRARRAVPRGNSSRII